jgi:hypothetical protein
MKKSGGALAGRWNRGVRKGLQHAMATRQEAATEAGARAAAQRERQLPRAAPPAPTGPRSWCLVARLLSTSQPVAAERFLDHALVAIPASPFWATIPKKKKKKT